MESVKSQAIRTTFTIISTVVGTVGVAYFLYVLGLSPINSAPQAEKELAKVKEELAELQKSRATERDRELDKLRAENDNYKKANSKIEFQLRGAYFSLEECQKSAQSRTEITPQTNKAEQPLPMPAAPQIDPFAEVLKATPEIKSTEKSFIYYLDNNSFVTAESIWRLDRDELPIGGKKYTHALYLSLMGNNKASCIFNFDKQYTELRFVVGFVDHKERNESQVSIYVGDSDGSLPRNPSKSITLHKDHYPQEVVIPITNSPIVKIEAKTNSWAELGIGDFRVR